MASGDVSGALAVLPQLRREILAPSLAQLTAADPLATCTALEHAPGLSCITPLMVAHTMGGLAKPDVPVATRTALLRYLQNRAIFSGSRDRVLHDLYVVLLILHPEEHELHRCVPPCTTPAAPASSVAYTTDPATDPTGDHRPATLTIPALSALTIRNIKLHLLSVSTHKQMATISIIDAI